jgi:hypothetical protein
MKNLALGTEHRERTFTDTEARTMPAARKHPSGQVISLMASHYDAGPDQPCGA